MAAPLLQLSAPEPKHPPELGGAYDKARRAYGSVSALLLAWELIGIELQDTPVESIKITLKSPQAVPYVLIALVFYFGFRLTIEWHQSAPERRRMRASLVDFSLAHLIGAGAIGLYSVQRLLEIQIADRIGGFTFTMFATGFATTWIALSSGDSVDRVLRVAIIGAITALVLMVRLAVSPADTVWLIAAALGLVLAGALRLVLHLRRRERKALN